MAGTFPTLKSGNTVFYPVVDNQSFGTDLIRFLDDTEQRWRHRNMLRRFKLTCTDINAYDSALILNFYRSQFGSFDSTWSLPFNGATVANLAFVQDGFQITENKRNRHTLSFDIIQVKSDLPTIPASPGNYFPQLTGGVTTTLPYQIQYDYRTTKDSVEVGKQYAWKWRTNPLGTFNVSLDALTTGELATVQNFFYSREGMKGSFIFLDPGGNLVNYSDLYSNASWSKSNITVGANVTDPFGGNLAMACTSTSSNGIIFTSVLPAGNASGFTLCASVWVQATIVGQNLLIGFVDAGFSVLNSQVFALPNGVWTRIQVNITLATNSAISMIIGGGGTWWNTQINLFGAQCVPMPGPGPRLLTPGSDSLRAKCRFAVDDFPLQYQQFGRTSVTLPIVEFS